MPKIKIYHMVPKENTEVIEGSKCLIDVDVLDSVKFWGTDRVELRKKSCQFLY